MKSNQRRRRPNIVVVGAGAAGTLTAIQLARTARRRSTGLDITLVDPADRWGRGAAYGTIDDQHLLNVPASGMSALPEEPGHFVAWRSHDEPDEASDGYAFASRRQFARYLEATLSDAVAGAAGEIGLRHARTRCVGIRRTAAGIVVLNANGHDLEADAVVLATGLPAAGHHWASDALIQSPFFVPDPWAHGALDVLRRDRSGPADVLLVGTGLTMVDVAISLSDAGNRADRTAACCIPKRRAAAAARA